MSLVIARDGKIFVVVNAEYLDPDDASNLANKIGAASYKARSQKIKRIVDQTHAERQARKGKREE